MGANIKAPKDGKEPNLRSSFAMKKELYDRVLKFCGEEERSLSWLVNKALEMYLTSKGY